MGREERSLALSLIARKEDGYRELYLPDYSSTSSTHSMEEKESFLRDFYRSVEYSDLASVLRRHRQDIHELRVHLDLYVSTTLLLVHFSHSREPMWPQHTHLGLTYTKIHSIG